MIIHSLKASGFRIIGEPIDIRFPDEGRIGILGQNESGKTTFLQAIEYALYGLRRGAGVEGERENLVTWGKNEAKLEIEFTSGQDTYVLQRVFGAKSGHRASLTPVIEGVKDKSNSVTSLRDIEAKIEQITGMDRDSFTKLIYVKQKDLDALRELAKSKREQLVNKVMGIEVFDDASANVKGDISNLDNEFEKKNLQLGSVRKNKEQYEAKQKQKVDLEASITDLQQNLGQKQNQLDEAKKLLEKYEWLYASDSTNEVISSLKGQQGEVKKDVEKIANLEKEIQGYKTALAKYKPQVEELETLRATFVDLERRLNEAEDSVGSIETRRQTVITKTGLTSKDIELLSQDLPAKKHRQLIRFALGLMAGLGLLLIGLITSVVLIVFALFVFATSAYLFYHYLKIDKLLTANSEVNSLTKQLEEQTTKVFGLKAEIEKITTRTSLESHEDVNNRLSTILEEIKTMTGQDSIPGMEAVARNAESTLKALKDSEPSKRKEELEKQIVSKETEIANLQKTKPASVDELQYGKEQHEVAKERVQELQGKYNNLDKEIQGKLGTIQQLSQDLELLKPDYELYPVLEQEVQTCQSKIKLLERVFLELSETSKELRNKVIPHARFIINQILPTLTDGRYSDFEITEDLKFKVHSNEAGGYKEREIFSGGTQDQFLIALRLAFTQSILDSRVMADKYSLLMDECISSSDDIRKQGIFEVLDAMKKTFSQIFVIAHEDISNFVDNHIILARNEHGYTEIKSRSW
jgi:exonuclease SbcC